ncbi:MAG: succinyl-diaminopimelate desuccinylase [Planctomycetota bacterium]|nr:succinyl-diaminopimelate desuccinylase [Planctomycetota bacterium]
MDAFLAELISRPSVTPKDMGCQELIGDKLEALDFEVEQLDFGEVTNLWARRRAKGPVFVFLGHTDVVASGPESEWSSPPFVPEIKHHVMYGRGTADMKGSIAAFLFGLEQFLAEHPEPKGTVAVLLTSDEEGPAVDGTVKVLEVLGERGTQIDYCLVGEPSSKDHLGDQVRVGRRGSLRAELTVNGIQGHTAYPHLADNPVHRFAPALAELVGTTWDEGNEHFPPTTFAVSNLHAGHGPTNVTPGHLRMSCNFRFGTASTDEGLRNRFEAVLERHGVDYEIEWRLAGSPFLTEHGHLVEAVVGAVQAETGEVPRLDTGGGTSDGRFVAPTGAQVVELGPLNASIHKVNEHVSLTDLDALSRIYAGILARLLG